MAFSLGEIAARVGGSLEGDPDCLIDRVATLQGATTGSISFLANPKYAKYLPDTAASAVILQQAHQADCPVASLVSENPYLTYAKVADLLLPSQAFHAGVHPSAVVAESAAVDPTAWIGPCSVIEEEVLIGPGCFVGPSCIVGRASVLGADCRLVARVTLCHQTQMGDRVLLHPGVIIGSDGFGLANDNGRWVKVAQQGRVCIGNDVEVGANTTIDRGALEDTVIGDGVKLDNLIQIAHNVHIGDHTAVAACSGISGSTHIGRYCTLGGGVGIAGHLEIGDNVHFSGMSLVTRSFTEPGYYSGGMPAVPNGKWRKSIARIRQLEEMARLLRRIDARVFPKK